MPRAVKGQRFGGRKKGTPNKVTGELRQMIRTALDEAGGVKYLVTVAQENPTAFCSLLGRILPQELVSGDGDAIRVVIQQYTPGPKK